MAVRVFFSRSSYSSREKFKVTSGTGKNSLATHGSKAAHGHDAPADHDGSTWLRVKRAGAFTAGRAHQYDVSFRTDEPWIEPTRLEQVGKQLTLDGGWDADGTITIESDNGLPLEILQVVMEYDAGN
jgi:hypothetical protein